jgi:transcriptional regulator with XRE-family HTH domain
MLRVTQNLISAYECDRLRLSAEMAVRLAQALAVSTDELLGLAQVTPPKKKQPSRRVLRRLQRIEALSKRDQEALLRTIDAFLSKSRTA